MTDREIEKLFNSNLGLVYFQAEKFVPKNSFNYDDAVEGGMLGLWKACKKFDKEINPNFPYFATKAIRWGIRHEMRKIWVVKEKEIFLSELKGEIESNIEGGVYGRETERSRQNNFDLL